MPHAANVKPYRWLAQYYDEISASMRSPADEARAVCLTVPYGMKSDIWDK